MTLRTLPEKILSQTGTWRLPNLDETIYTRTYRSAEDTYVYDELEEGIFMDNGYLVIE